MFQRASKLHIAKFVLIYTYYFTDFEVILTIDNVNLPFSFYVMTLKVFKTFNSGIAIRKYLTACRM